MSISPAAPRRIDTASRKIEASAQAIYDAFVDPEALQQWLPPGEMSARILQFEPYQGGRYCIELTYESSGVGKTSGRTDVSRGAFLKLEPGRRIVWSVEFQSDNPAFAGTMLMTWSLEPCGHATEVTITAENVPPGISKADHHAGLSSTLANLAQYVNS